MTMTGYFKTERNPLPPLVKGWLWLETTINEATGTNMKINIGDVFKDVDSMKINIGDVFKDVAEVKQNIGDTWKVVF